METPDSSSFQLQVWALNEFLIGLEFNIWKASYESEREWWLGQDLVASVSLRNRNET